MRIVALTVLFFATAPAFAFDRAEIGAPTRLTLGPGELGEQPESAPGTRVLASAKASLLVDTPNLFGAIGLGARLHGSYAMNELFWLSFGVEAVEMRNVINASVTKTQLALGPLTTGFHVAAINTPNHTLAPYLRVMWPTSTAFENARQWGLELGLSQSVEVHEMLSWLSGLMLPLELTGLGGRTWARFTPTLATELAFHPRRWVDLLVGIEIKLGSDPAGVFEYFAPKAAFRFYPVKGLLVELKAMLPLFGLERTDYVFSFGLGWVFEPAPAASSRENGPATDPALHVSPETPATAPSSAPASAQATDVTSML